MGQASPPTWAALYDDLPGRLFVEILTELYDPGDFLSETLTLRRVSAARSALLQAPAHLIAKNVTGKAEHDGGWDRWGHPERNASPRESSSIPQLR